jgi:hypothetical protein
VITLFQDVGGWKMEKIVRHLPHGQKRNPYNLTFINYAEGQHGFDAYDDNNQSREIIKKTIEFWKFHLFRQ